MWSLDIAILFSDRDLQIHQTMICSLSRRSAIARTSAPIGRLAVPRTLGRVAASSQAQATPELSSLNRRVILSAGVASVVSLMQLSTSSQVMAANGKIFFDLKLEGAPAGGGQIASEWSPCGE